METTLDDFFDGKIQLLQPKTGVRATSDSILAASAVPIKTGESLLDVGCANGVIALCVAFRVPSVSLTGLEIQPELADLARQNARRLAVNFDVICEDLLHAAGLKARQFNHVVSNPPFYNTPYARQNTQQKIAYHQQISLGDWVKKCLIFVAPRGSFTTIIPTENVPEIVSVMSKKMGQIELIPVFTNTTKAAKRCIVRGILGSKANFTVRPPIICQNGKTPTEVKIFRAGESLNAAMAE